MDQYSELRSIPLLTVFQWLGIDTGQFKTRKGGKEWYGKCIFHEAKSNTGSFSFTSDLANCFSCNTKFRGAIDAVKLHRKVGFKEAVEWLTELKGSNPSSSTKKEPTEAPNASGHVLQPLTKDTWKNYAQPCEWLEKRIPDATIRERYGVYMYNNPARKSAYSNRVMIPVKDVEGVLYGYLGRLVPPASSQGEPAPAKTPTSSESSPPAKYLFPKDFPKSRFLFGAYELKAGMFGSLPSRVVYLVESPLAVMNFASMGLPAVSPFGWSVSDEQIQILVTIAKGVVYLPDRNKSESSGEPSLRLSRRLWLRCPPLPTGIDDPEQMTKEQILAL